MIVESGRWVLKTPAEQEVVRCCVTDGSTEVLSGKCVIVYRIRTNVHFEIKQLLEVSQDLL